MTKEQKKTILDAMTILAPMEIKNPTIGFNGYLLRTKAESIEKGSSTFLIKQPEKDYEFEFLPNEMDERLKLRKNWYRKTDQKSTYVCVNVEPNENNFDNFLEILDEMDENDYVQFVKDLTDMLIKEYLPSFEPFAAVWHMCQYKDDGIRPPHIHILMKKFKRLTKEQNEIIVRQ